MVKEPRLITPQGETIVLSNPEYEKVAKTLGIAHPPAGLPSPAEIRELLNDLRGKYADGPSLTRALLEERRQERQREEAQARRHARSA